MAVRMGEMMVVIRAQDFASRTIHRVSGELNAMQRQQGMISRSYRQYLPMLRQEAQLVEKAAIQHEAYQKAALASGNATYGWTKAGRAQAAALATTNERLLNLRRGMENLPSALQGFRDSVPGVERFALALKKLDAERLHRIGSALSGIGRTTQLWGAVGTAAFGIMANSAAKFSASAATAGTQMRDLTGDVYQGIRRSKELQKAILDMSMAFPASAEDMTKAAYDIFSSMNLMHNGVMNVRGGLKLLAVANKSAVAGQTDLAEATNAMIVALNTFDPHLRDVQGTMDDVFNIVRFGKLRLEDLSRVFASFAAAAASAGLSLKTVGPAFAALTLFTSPDRAAAGLGRLIELFNTDAFQKGFEAMHVDVIDQATGKLRPLQDIMQQIVKIRPDLAASQTAAIKFFTQVTKLSGLTKAGIQGTVQARRAFALWITHISTFNDIAVNATKNKNELDKAFAERMADPGVQWEITKNRLRALAIIIGQEALPVFNKIGQWVSKAIRWFKSLNDGLKGSIISWAAWISVGALIAGIFLSIGGGAVQLASYFKLMAINAQLAATATGEAAASVSLFGRAMNVAMGVLALGGIFLLTQHMLGFRQAIVLTATAWVLWRTNAIKSIAVAVTASIVGARATAAAWKAALASTGWGLFALAAGEATILIMNHWDQVGAYFRAWSDDVGGGFIHLWHQVEGGAVHAAGTIIRAFGSITGASGVEGLGKNLQHRGNQIIAQTDDFVRRYNAYVKKFHRQHKDDQDPFSMAAFMKRVGKITGGLTTAQFRKYWDDMANTVGNSTKKAADLAKAHAEAIKQATDNMNQSVKQAAQNLMQTYEQLQQQNQQALGGLFQGPTMQGILGNVFSNINDTLRQFGVQIPVPFAILKQDLQQSVTYFKRWRSDIAAVAKRLPKDIRDPFIAQIQAMGPAQGMSILEGLMQAPKGQFSSIVRLYKQGQKLTDKATQDDMNRKLEYWKQFGKDAAWATIQGIISDPRNYRIQKMYENYVRTTYGSILKKVFQDDVAAYMKNAIAQAQAAAAQAGTTKVNAPNPFASIGGGGGQLTFAQRLTRQINQAIQTITRLMNFYGPLSPQQQQQLRAARRRRAIATYERGAAISVRNQMRGERGQTYYTIVYDGDKVTIKADGATVESVTRALAKKHFHKKTKGRNPGKLANFPR